ncbi:MAG: hydrolase [Candidatus Caldatribacteriota bacterium]
MVKRLRVACLQVSAYDYDKKSKNKKNILSIIDQAAKLSPQLMVLPECVFPAYYLSPLVVKDYLSLQTSTNKFIEEVKEKAKLYQCYLALGIVEFDSTKNKLFNSALLINPKGEEIGCFRKSFLWHFDHHWFEEGNYYPVFQTEFGKIGMFICADGRMPEIIRCLSLQGADLLIDLTNWVTAGLQKETLTNPQVEYMIPTRALENRIWIVGANKVGMEAGTVLYCGKSAIFSPEGKAVKIASSFREEIISFEIPLEKNQDKTIDKQINLFTDRRPELYSELTQPTQNLPIYSTLKKKKIPSYQESMAAIVQLKSKNNLEEYLKKIEFFILNLLEQEAMIIVFPDESFDFLEEGEKILTKIRQLTQHTRLLCVITIVEKSNNYAYKTTFLVESGKIVGKYRKTHLEQTEKNIFTPGNLGLPVFKTSYGNIGIMLGYEGLFPEIPRLLTLKGAELIIWPAKFPHDKHINICRTRSAENRIWTICSNSINHQGLGHSIITSPSGQILTSCLEKTEQASLGSINPALSHYKEVVPHTNTILNRKPETYAFLINKLK